jgi:L-threonylcarbamoyladenylate synthase
VITRILEPNERNIAWAGQALRRGEIVGMPTETVYGLAAAVFDERAIAAVFAAKARPTFDPLIVHVARGDDATGVARLDALRAARLVTFDEFDDRARARAALLAEAFWPGPLTLVFPKDAAVPDLVTSGLPTVAVRMPRHPVAQALIKAAGTPVAAPSANRFGSISPTTAAAVVAELSGRVPLVLDGGTCEVGLESSVVAIDATGVLTLLRPGGVPRGEMERAVGGPVRVADRAAGLGPLASPGLLDAHYAPTKTLRLLRGPVPMLTAEDAAELRALLPAGSTAGLLIGRGDADAAAAAFERLTGRRTVARALSIAGDSVEAARALFAALRALDASEAQALFAEPWPNAEGLGHAIGDRLTRAARGGA